MTSPDRAIVCGVGMGHNCNTRPDLMRTLFDWLKGPAAPREGRPAGMQALHAGGMPGYPDDTHAFAETFGRHEPFVPNWDDAPCGTDELDATRGLFLRASFPDPEGLLDTARSDFERFLAEAGLAGAAVPVEAKEAAGLDREEYRLSVGTDAVSLEASDAEGIRRGLYFLRDELAGSPHLKRGTVRRKPWLRNRISRCFFAPIKRPPFNLDELMDDVDYYPEEYLGRLAHEGVNGLWLTVAFREICDTSIRPAPPDAARRIAKLRATVDRCRRYGIRVWAFCIEPFHWSAAAGNPVPPGCEELLGPGVSADGAASGPRCFCVDSETARRYLRECTNSLFRAVPNLGGMIVLCHGERMTSCPSRIDRLDDTGAIPCPKRCGRTAAEILADVLGALKRGMADASPDAELIGWIYAPQEESASGWMAQLPALLPPDVALAFNFESGVAKRQLGAVRVGGDYWLSAVGPSDRFARMAEAARGRCRLAAKLQVSCSHECATVPFVPVPELLYRKYRAMRELGVRDAIQCWFFGNCPGLMNEAAGRLAFEDFASGEDAFLDGLAGPGWGRDRRHAVAAWKRFAEGYSNYPLDIRFQYYGPMHDGPVWPLHLRQAMRPLTRSWKPETFPAGDAVGECAAQFGPDELAQLTGTLSREWRAGLAELEKAPAAARHPEAAVARALDLVFRSGHDVLRFYALRNALLDSPPDAAALLAGMKEIVREEIGNSLRLADLCERDRRLGYHSEAQVRKFFPDKLRWRAGRLRELLAGDFAAAEAVLAEGGDIGAFLAWQGETAVAGRTYGANGIAWCFESDADKVVFHLDFESAGENPEEAHLFFMDRKGARNPLLPVRLARKDHPRTASGWHADWSVSRLLLGQESEFFFGVERTEVRKDGTVAFTNDVPGAFLHEPRLCLGSFSPDKLRRVKL